MALIGDMSTVVLSKDRVRKRRRGEVPASARSGAPSWRARARAGPWPGPLALGVLLLLVAGGGGCVSSERVRLERERAFQEGRQKTLSDQLLQEQPVVFFLGDVRQPRVSWHEGLTLAEALMTAQYTWNWDPHLIHLTRNGEVHVIPPRQLLRGVQNPVLEPGDVVEVRH